MLGLPEIKMAAMTLEESVKGAVDSNVETTTEETITEEKAEEEEKEQEQEVEVPKIDPRTQTALNLLDALEGPGAKDFLAGLARRAGILGAEQGKTTQQITKSTLEVLKENVPDEYHFLVEGFAKGIEQVVAREIKAATAPVAEQMQAQTLKAVERETDAAFEKFHAKHKDGKDFDKQMTELSKKLPYTGDYPMEEYLESLYAIASKDKVASKTVERTVRRINQNAKDVRETSVEVDEKTIKVGSKLPTLDESLRAGFRGERFI